MQRYRSVIAAAAIAAAAGTAAIVLQAQAREWTTSNGDAQRSSWVRTDARLTKAAVEKGELKFLWKMKLSGAPRQLHSMTQPILLDRLISHRGFKALAFVGVSAERVYAIDTDLARTYWESVLNYSSITPPANTSWTCPGGLIAAVTRPTVASVPAFGGGRGGGRGGQSGSSVGEPGRGAPSLQQAQGRGRGNDPAPPDAAGRRGANPAAPPAPGTPAAQGRGAPSGGLGGGPTENVYVLASDGFVRALNAHNGAERYPAVQFVPANAKPSGLIMVDGVLYTSTSDNCGAVPNGVYAVDLNTEATKTVSWETGGPSVAGAAGPTIGSDGTVYVAVAEDSANAHLANTPSSDRRYASSIVALEPRTLKVKDWFSAPGADFNASPVVIRHQNKDLVLATANDGRLYVLDSTSLGGADHKTALHVTGKYTLAGLTSGVATWEDQDTRWILAPAIGAPAGGLKFTPSRPARSQGAASLPPTSSETGAPPAPASPLPYISGSTPPQMRVAVDGRVVAFKLADQSGKVTLEPAWASTEMISPLTPLIFNGVVFAVSSGEYRAPSDARLNATRRAQRSLPAVLYALDPLTGRALWNSGRTMTSFARGGISAAAGQIYVVTFDNTLYAFGIPMEH